MNHCSYCNTPLNGRYCTGCGTDSATVQGATIEVSAGQSTTAAATQRAFDRSPGYVAPTAGVPAQSMGSTADNGFTHDAEFLLRSTGERIAWQGKPSVLMIVPRAVAWGLILFVCAGLLRHHMGLLFGVFLIAAFQVGARYLNWRNTTYRITSQRLEYSGGVFSCTTAATPLNRIGNVTILRPFPWLFFGLGHLELDIPDEANRSNKGVHTRVLLKCLPNLETTRDLIHSSSAIGNQLWDQYRYQR